MKQPGYFLFSIIIIAMLQACTSNISKDALLGKWKYVKVGVPDSSPPDTVTREQLKENNPSIEFKSDNSYQINWGGKPLSQGVYMLSGNNIKVTENLGGGKTRGFQFYVSELSPRQITFETVGQGGSRVTAVKQ